MVAILGDFYAVFVYYFCSCSSGACIRWESGRNTGSSIKSSGNKKRVYEVRGMIQSVNCLE